MAVHPQEASHVARYSIGGIGASQGLIDLHDVVFERFMPHHLQQLLECDQTALEARFGRLPAPLDIAPAVASAVQGQAEKRQSLWAAPVRAQISVGGGLA